MSPGRRIAALVVLVAVVGGIAAFAGANFLRTPTPTVAAGPPAFVEETASSGLEHAYTGSALYQVGGGVAVLDCDADGRLDLFLAGGASPAALFRNVAGAGGQLVFERVHSGLELPDLSGAYPLDLGGDDGTDLALLGVADNTGFWHNDGDCGFTPANEAYGLGGIRGHVAAFSATWEADAELPTIALGRYLELDDGGRRTLTCDTGELRRPADDDRRRYGDPFTLAPGYCALGMLFSDWDGSGRRDLRVTNDREYYVDGMDQLWRVAPGEEPTLYTADDGWVAMQIWGMGIASQDITGDGLPEVYLTSQADNKLQTLTAGPSKPTFRDIAFRRGVTATQPFTGEDDNLPSTAWHPEFADVNNDGFPDLFVSKGNVGEQEGYAMRDPSNLFLGQPDGTFVEAADRAGILNFERGRGAALADFNNDGLLDLVEVNYLGPTRLWRNVGSGTPSEPVAMGHWLALDPRQPGPNAFAIGARVEVEIGERLEVRELTIGGGHAGGKLGWTHLGLGPATSARVRVTWPDGEVGPWQTLYADRFWRLTRDAEPEAWSPPS